MSELVERVGSVASKAGVEACWQQWLALANERRSMEGLQGDAIIDPESLILMSLAVRQYERRLQDRLLWWVGLGSSLVSVQRMQTLRERFPASLGPEVGWFARMCVDAGDRRWQSTVVRVGSDMAQIPARSGKGPDKLRLLQPSTVLLRLRAGFGVGAKADLLAFLIGVAEARMQREARTTVETIAQAISYTASSVRRAAGDMVLARLVQASTDRPTQYGVNKAVWIDVLGLDTTSTRSPAWRFWAQVFAFLAKCIEWSRETLDLAAVVQASRARDIVEEHGQGLAWNGIALPDPQLYSGAGYLEAFNGLVDDVAAWVGVSA